MFLALLVFAQVDDNPDKLYAAARMRAQLIFVDYGILQLGMAFRAFARGAHGVCVLAGGIGYRPLTVDEECTDDQRKPDHYSDEDRSKWH